MKCAFCNKDVKRFMVYEGKAFCSPNHAHYYNDREGVGYEAEKVEQTPPVPTGTPEKD